MLVWNASEQAGFPFGPLVKLLMLTGQRLAEVAAMTWSDVDLPNRSWMIPRQRTKNNVAHEVPLSEASIAIFTSLPRLAGQHGYFFTTNGTTPVSGFSRAKGRIDMADQHEL